jgi:hypothetical protein
MQTITIRYNTAAKILMYFIAPRSEDCNKEFGLFAFQVIGAISQGWHQKLKKRFKR